MSLAIDRAALAAAHALAARQPQANLGSILPSLAGAAASLIPGVGSVVAPVVSGLVGDLTGGGGGSSGGSSGGSQTANGLSAAEAAELAQQAATGNANQTAGLVKNALSQVGTNTSDADSAFAAQLAGLGSSPALAAGIKPATLGAPPQIKGVGNTSSVGGDGGVIAPVAPGAVNVTNAASALTPTTPAAAPATSAPSTAQTGAVGPAGGVQVGTHVGSPVYVGTGEPGPNPSYQDINGVYYFTGDSGNGQDGSGIPAQSGDSLAAAIAEWENMNPQYAASGAAPSSPSATIGSLPGSRSTQQVS